MSLPHHTPPAPLSLLPFDGEVLYFGRVLTPEQASGYLHTLDRSVDWKQEELLLFGRRHILGRRVAWYGDPGMAYTYSGVKRNPLPWTRELLTLRESVSAISGTSFNSCLLNRYADGTQGMGWHSDDEPELGPEPVIASLSFGAERTMRFRHKQSGATAEVLLEHGSLLLMRGATQMFWKHALPVRKRVPDLRINLTFRHILPPG